MIKKICTALLAVLTTLTAGTFLVVAATGAQAKGGPGPGPYGSACPQLRFFGIRGSGEKPSDNSGYGPTIWQMRFMLLQLFPGTATSAVDYPAIDVQWWNPNYAIAYEKSVEAGVQSLTNQYDLFRANCATTPVVFAGYSQGVDVAYRVYKSLPPSEQSRIILTGLGDPHFNPAQRWVDEGSFNPKLQSILVHFGGYAAFLPARRREPRPVLVLRGRPGVQLQRWLAHGLRVDAADAPVSAPDRVHRGGLHTRGGLLGL